MTKPQPAAAGDSRAVAESFAVGLRELRLDAGQPSFRVMAKEAGAISHTTLYEAASGTRLPSWSTTEAFVRACGGDEADWRRRWMQAAAAVHHAPQSQGPAALEPASSAIEESTAEAQPLVCRCTEDVEASDESVADPVGTPSGRAEDRTRGRQGFRLVAAFVAGILIGAGTALAIVGANESTSAATPSQDCPASDGMAHQDAILNDAVLATSSGNAPRLAADGSGPAAAPSWMARPASDQEILSGTSTVLPVISSVTQGDALIVTMMLTSTCPGVVAVTDSQGDLFESVGDEKDTRHHRVLVFASFGVKPLTTADSIRVTYPHASKYHVAVDEFRGISTARGVAHAHGESGGTAFTTSSTPVICTAGDLMVGAVGTNTGTAPEFSTGWTTLPVLKLSSYRLTTAYRTATTTGPCAATGQTTAQWGAVLAAFH